MLHSTTVSTIFWIPINNRIGFSTALLAMLVVIGFGMWSTVVRAPPAVAATITKSAILEDAVAPKVYAEPYGP